MFYILKYKNSNEVRHYRNGLALIEMDCKINHIEQAEFELVESENEPVIGYDGKLYLFGYEPLKPWEIVRDEVEKKRAELMVKVADPLRFDYDEDLARYGAEDEKTVRSKEIWLAKKDEIRQSNPYPVI